VDERSLARAIWTEQTDCFTAQIAAQIFQYWPATERNAETMQIDHGRLS
jgi:hypothetical protein